MYTSSDKVFAMGDVVAGVSNSSRVFASFCGCSQNIGWKSNFHTWALTFVKVKPMYVCGLDGPSATMSCCLNQFCICWRTYGNREAVHQHCLQGGGTSEGPAEGRCRAGMRGGRVNAI